MRVTWAAILFSLVAPASAWAGGATMVTRDVPLTQGRQLAASAERFDLVGLHWQGQGRVSFRTRALSGAWSPWHDAAPEPEDRPGRGTPEAARRAGWRVGNPYWTGGSDAIRYRFSGPVRRLRAHFVRSPVSRIPLRATAVAGSPAILNRFAWQANEGIRRSSPAYATNVRFALVHHTAGSNSYSRSASAAIVRAIQTYHVRGNGWNDIGYNFLVDRYGQVFEGRYGGITRAVVGAHAEGFNTGSVGVSVLGSYQSGSISKEARAALVRLLAWRLDVAHVDPVSTLSSLSGGNPRFPPGSPVFLRAVSGHRDTGFTTCPGAALYGLLNAVAGDVGKTGLPKLYSPAARGNVGQQVRFTARLSSALPWSVTVKDAAGRRVAGGSGSGTRVAWTWDARALPRKAHFYAIEAGPSVRPVAGRIGSGATSSPSPPPPAGPTVLLGRIQVSPQTVTPNGDGVQDTTTVSYELAEPATVTATLVDASNRLLATLFSERQAAGPASFRFTADSLPDGKYTILLRAVTDAGAELTASATVIVSRLLRALAVSPAVFSPNGDGRSDTLRLSFALLGSADVTLRIQLGTALVATPFSGPLAAGTRRLSWDGAALNGRLPDGRYRAVLSVTDPIATITQTVSFASDLTPPRLTRVAGRRLRVNEPVTVTLTAGGTRVSYALPRAGAFAVPRLAGLARVRVVVHDLAGNVGIPLTVS